MPEPRMAFIKLKIESKKLVLKGIILFPSHLFTLFSTNFNRGKSQKRKKLKDPIPCPNLAMILGIPHQVLAC